MFSDNIHFWQTPKLLLAPRPTVGIIKIGNCGSPVETKAGWLVLSQGVGAMRKYCLGAFLLEIQDGGAEGSRTPDLLIANETLYQLSYDPIKLSSKHLQLKSQG
jgi:predicted GH43/DUF377 family glycosyl hydrolase